MASFTQLFYLASRLFPDRLPVMDLFTVWTQEFNHEFDDFLKASLGST
jgi:hypothetical protein